ncbi:cytochrome P450 [Aspergillus karnatakaensis]|uniref:cytochrome P450 n=1 Tax=Aspergillus karnatakaensis TaxID=1810916 RepID=UPI003CCE4C45
MGFLIWSLPSLEVLSFTSSQLQDALSLWLVLSCTLLVLGWDFLRNKSARKIPFVDTRGRWEYTYTGAKRRFVTDGAEIIASGLEKYPLFYTITDKGLQLILSGEYADEIQRRDDSFSRLESFETDWYARMSSANGKSHAAFARHLASKLTTVMPALIQPLSEEVGIALRASLTDKQEWSEIPLSRTMVRIISQTSTRAFAGQGLCRNSKWIESSTTLAHSILAVTQRLYEWPRSLHGLVTWFEPSARQLRCRTKECQRLFESLLEIWRQMIKEDGNEGDQRQPEFNLMDTMLESPDVKEKPDNLFMAQLALALAAVHSTTDILGKVILDLARNPHMIEPLRQEIISVVGQRGLGIDTVSELKLLDSVLKETQRMNPVSTLPIHRIATQKVTLNDGTIIPRGTEIALSTNRTMDPDIHASPDKWDGYRFFNMQKTSSEEKSGLVDLSSDHLGFGYGKHACPGRFFAAHESKIVLCHILLKYDWTLVDPRVPNIEMRGCSPIVNSVVKIAVRRRNSEIEL